MIDKNGWSTLKWTSSGALFKLKVTTCENVAAAAFVPVNQLSISLVKTYINLYDSLTLFIHTDVALLYDILHTK